MAEHARACPSERADRDGGGRKLVGRRYRSAHSLDAVLDRDTRRRRAGHSSRHILRQRVDVFESADYLGCEGGQQFVEPLGCFPLRGMPSSWNDLHLAAPQGRHIEGTQVFAIDQLFALPE